MPSKYDLYWQKRLGEIKNLLEEAYEKGVSRQIDVSDLKDFGKRQSWYGDVILSQSGIERSEMAHARSLGNVILKNALLPEFKDAKFRLVISMNLKLRAEKVGASKRSYKMPFSSRKVEVKKAYIYERKEDVKENKKRLVEILTEIPWGVWEKIVRQEPEWVNMESFLPIYGFGPFSVLMVVAGLNDYQLKGKAEKVYWSEISRLLKNSPPPQSPEELYNLLEPFYRQERLWNVKLNRLDRFFQSLLPRKLWESTPSIVAKEFPDIWINLAQIMRQRPQDKTISFAMKCLGMSLMMAGEYNFDFTKIPIPVDSRVARFTERVGILFSSDAKAIRQLWSEILTSLRECYPSLTMIHLDSLVWQIASLEDAGIKSYFEGLGIHKVGNELMKLL
ncbi:N-glycosylase/DNA lyase [Candidatus Aerophobetes bacterium]|nr:N-glycosylase/DNA lyase [Candidatus Aerophobetes bacterium]